MAAHQPEQHLNAIVSVASAVMAFILADIQAFFSLCAAIVAIGSGLMAIRYYYYSTKKIKGE